MAYIEAELTLPGKLLVDNAAPVTWNKKAFDRLVLGSKQKEMINALVRQQTESNPMDDIISGKGNGLIILLHGSPGTGKTLTAERCAWHIRDPETWLTPVLVLQSLLKSLCTE